MKDPASLSPLSRLLYWKGFLRKARHSMENIGFRKGKQHKIIVPFNDLFKALWNPVQI